MKRRKRSWRRSTTRSSCSRPSTERASTGVLALPPASHATPSPALSARELLVVLVTSKLPRTVVLGLGLLQVLEPG